jgi:hypothetical protein
VVITQLRKQQENYVAEKQKKIEAYREEQEKVLNF